MQFLSILDGEERVLNSLYEEAVSVSHLYRCESLYLPFRKEREEVYVSVYEKTSCFIFCIDESYLVREDRNFLISQ